MTRIAVVLLALVACGKSVDEEIREQAAKDQARAAANPEPKPVQRELPPQKEKPPPDPEPTTPEEVDKARKKAMIEGRDKDVIRFCEMGKVDEKGDKADGQALLGCTLAACRINEPDKAKAWSKVLVTTKQGKPLMEQAVKTCTANKVAL